MWTLVVFFANGPMSLSGFTTQALAVSAARTLIKQGGDSEQTIAFTTVQVL